MNFWTIFLCLFIGAVVGFEFGKYIVSRKIRGVLDSVSEELQKVADDLKRKQEHANALKQEKAKNLMKMVAEILPRMDENDFCNKMGISQEELKQLKESSYYKELMKQRSEESWAKEQQ